MYIDKEALKLGTKKHAVTSTYPELADIYEQVNQNAYWMEKL